MTRLPPPPLLILALLLPTLSARAEDAPAPPAAPSDPIAMLVDTLSAIEDPVAQAGILKGMNAELQGRRGLKLPAGWKEVSAKLAKSPDAEVRFLTTALSALFGDSEAVSALRGTVKDTSAAPETRKRALSALAGSRDPALPPLLRDLLKDRDLRAAAVRGLAAFDDPGTPAAVLELYPGLTDDEKRDALSTLASRAPFAKALLEAVRAGRIPKGDLSAVVRRHLRGLKNPDVARGLTEIVGQERDTPGDKAKEIARLRAVVTAKDVPPGDLSRGRAIFSRTCAACHTLFGTGGGVGPELTGANRADLDYLLTNIVDPNALIGKGYEMVTVTTKDERVMAGIVRKQDDASVTLVMPAETTVVPRSEIDTLTVSDVSMMPEGQLAPMPATDVRDLLAYLQSPAQVPMLATPDNVAAFFSGRDLTNWDGTEGLWKVENGEIVGKAEKGLKRNDFLKSLMAVDDFRLIVEVKLVPNEANSGIQFRTEPREGGEVKGYQADVGAGWWGKLYEENGRALLWKLPGDQHVKANDWNLYEVLAVGHRIRTALNGHLCVDLDDPAGATRGIIAFQVHAGGPTEVRFRNVKLELNPKFELVTVK